MNEVMMVLGYAAATVIVGLVLYVIYDLTCDIGRVKGDNGATAGYIFSVFKFGVVYAKPGTRLNQNLNQMRETEDKTVFVSCPLWFNKYVKNVGGVKKSK